MTQFPALPGLYKLVFLYLEPLSAVAPAVMVMISPGAGWFLNELVPPSSSVLLRQSAGLDPRANVAVWQLANCYFLFGLLSSVLFRTIRDALSDKLAVQERILGASLACLAIGDLTHMIATFVPLPDEIKYNFANWNAMTHGNITFTLVLFVSRIAWFLGIGRTRYYFGQSDSLRSKKS